MQILEDFFSEGMKKKHKDGEGIQYRMKERVLLRLIKGTTLLLLQVLVNISCLYCLWELILILNYPIYCRTFVEAVWRRSVAFGHDLDGNATIGGRLLRISRFAASSSKHDSGLSLFSLTFSGA